MPIIPGLDLVTAQVAKIQKNTFVMIGDLLLFLGDSPKDWEEKLGHEWAEHSTLGDRPRLQSVGNKNDEIQLGFQLHAAKADIGNIWDTLQGYKEGAKVLPVTMGDGEYLGTFVITEMTFKRLATFPTGTTMAAQIGISLKEWTDNPVLQTATRPPKATTSNPKARDKKTWTTDPTTGRITSSGMMSAH